VGKTLAVATSLQEAYKGRSVRAIVVAPLSVCPTWAGLLEEMGFPVLRAYAGKTGNQARARMLADVRAFSEGVIVIGWRRIASRNETERRQRRTSEITETLVGWNPDAVILDESHNMASPSADQAKAARRLAWKARWVRLLTGTPAPNHFGNLWGQLVALDKAAFYPSYERFAQRYLIRDAMFPKMVKGHINETELQANMLPFVGILRREDCFGPDQWVTDVRALELPDNIQALYDELAQSWLLAEPDLEVSAEHILARLTRLQQIASGYVTDDAGETKHLHDVKTQAALSDLEEIVESGEKALVFHRFTWEGDAIEKGARSLGVPVLRIGGDVAAGLRQNIIDTMKQPGAKICIVQSQSGGVGTDFSEVPYQLVLSQTFSFVIEEQAHDRTYKPNTQRFVTYYRVKNTVDEFIASVLESKVAIHNAVRQADRATMAFGKLRRPSLRKRAS
jgi:SNF2 family DNA or RNA helicase